MIEKVSDMGIMGAICGDIIGLPYELRANRTKNYNFGLNLTDFSDDTILTVAIAEWLMGERTEERLQKLLLEYAHRFRDKNVWGQGFMSWVESGGTLDRTGVASNGAAMRVSPIGYAAQSEDEVMRLAEISARVSHNSDEAVRGAQAVALSVFLVREGKNKDDIRQILEKTFGYNLQRTVEEIRKDYQFEILCDKCVPESIICWLQSDTYLQTVRNAVSLGGDADTMAAIAGSIAAATPGMEIPEEIVEPCYELLPKDFKEVVAKFDDLYSKIKRPTRLQLTEAIFNHRSGKPIDPRLVE